MPPDRLRNLEYLPEPEDPRMLTAIDPEAPGYAPSAYGATFNESNAWRNATEDVLRQSKPRPWGIMVALCVISLLILAYPQMTLFFADALAPDSEWAYEDTNIYALQDQYGLSGDGVRVCIVDTGFESDHPALKDVNLVGYRDFVGNEKYYLRQKIPSAYTYYIGKFLSTAMVMHDFACPLTNYITWCV